MSLAVAGKHCLPQFLEPCLVPGVYPSNSPLNKYAVIKIILKIMQATLLLISDDEFI